MKRFIAFICLISLMIIFSGCSHVQHNTELEASVSDMVKSKNQNIIHINTLTHFNWDKAFLFTPYYPEEDMKKDLGVEYNDPSGIKYRDDIYLLVFIKDDQVVQYAELPCQLSDRTIEYSIGINKYITQSNATISYKSLP